MIDYKDKYSKYKTKYLKLKGGYQDYWEEQHILADSNLHYKGEVFNQDAAQLETEKPIETVDDLGFRLFNINNSIGKYINEAEISINEAEISINEAELNRLDIDIKIEEYNTNDEDNTNDIDNINKKIENLFAKLNKLKENELYKASIAFDKIRNFPIERFKNNTRFTDKHKPRFLLYKQIFDKHTRNKITEKLNKIKNNIEQLKNNIKELEQQIRNQEIIEQNKGSSCTIM